LLFVRLPIRGGLSHGVTIVQNQNFCYRVSLSFIGEGVAGQQEKRRPMNSPMTPYSTYQGLCQGKKKSKTNNSRGSGLGEGKGNLVCSWEKRSLRVLRRLHREPQIAKKGKNPPRGDKKENRTHRMHYTASQEGSAFGGHKAPLPPYEAVITKKGGLPGLSQS